MLPRLCAIAVLLAAIPDSQQQRHDFFPAHSHNPAAFAETFAHELRRQLKTSQSVVENFAGTQATVTDLLGQIGNESAYRLNVSACQISFRKFLADLAMGKKYAILVVDSWGKLESGIALANIQWMGRYYECINTRTTQFSGKYFIASFGGATSSASTLGLGLWIGVCLPDTCSSDEAEQILQPLSEILNLPVDAYSPVQPTTYTAVDILALIIASLLGCFVIIGTAYELYLTHKVPPEGGHHRFGMNHQLSLSSLSVLSSVTLSFSIIKNTRTILDTTQKEGSINVLHGLRFFSITWIILGHTFEFGTSFVDNGVDAATVYVTDWTFQGVANATFSVDTFFFLSGLLATYLGLKEMRKRDGNLNVPVMYAYRYLRLTPAYAFCILITSSLYSKFGNGPIWPTTAESFREPCETYWWTNLLYINNMYPAKLSDECFAWGWYLANDMQFFLVLPLLLYLIYRKPAWGIVVLNLGVVLCMVANGVISSHYNQQPGVAILGSFLYSAAQATSVQEGNFVASSYLSNDTHTPSPTSTTEATQQGPSRSDIFWSDAYAKPWCRMGVYFIGVMTGYILRRTQNKIQMNRIVALIGWMSAFSVALAIVYGLFGYVQNGQYLPVALAAFYNAVTRPAWGLCLMWLVLASVAGYGGPISGLLSWKALIPLSRLTYCTYLVHPPVIYWVYGIMETKLHFSIPMIAVIYSGIVIFSFGVAYVVAVLIEFPVLELMKIIFGRSRAKATPNTTISAEQHYGDKL